MPDQEPRTSARPRVLLADDHLAFVEWVTRFLAGSFDVVGLASDGRQALDLARRLRPDLVVLDVAMPNLDGFQTLEQLQRDSPHTKVVFLTMHRDDEFVAAAINGGAHGYVLKSRISTDLFGAINHALAGRLWVPSLGALATVSGSRHTIHVHANDRRYLDDVSELVGATLRSGEQVVMVTSEPTRHGVAQRLQARQMNLAVLAQQGHYIEHDSALALSQVMRHGRPDKERLRQFVHDLERLRFGVPNRPSSRLTIVGDMTVSLCRNGDFEAALDIERIWNELTGPLPFFTVCSYPIECFEQPAARHQLPRISAEHSAVVA